MNVGTSPYHAIGAVFCRDIQGDLISIEGRNASQIQEDWPTIRSQIDVSTTSFTTLPSGSQINTTQVNISASPHLCSCPTAEQHCHTIRELVHKQKEIYVGILSCYLYEHDTERRTFRDWFENFLLLETTLAPIVIYRSLSHIHTSGTVESITSIFERTLRNVASQDEWNQGAALFTRKVSDFVSRSDRIQMAVPAFPCKSPNPRKVGGLRPDMAERIALRTLHAFAKSVGEVYPPGITIWVISDGHVFSDCIGVDDQTVTDYGESLRLAYESMFESEEDCRKIQFRSLPDILFSNSDAVATLPEACISKTVIDHPIQSNRLKNAELARQIMMAGCHSSRARFKELVTSQDPSTLSLYRGQARFMQDDLATPDFISKSAKQRKKLSFTVAEEMIARNQAYSNLLELLLPNYIRLSIHAHSNRGPKFGICLLPRHQVRAIDSIQNRHEVVPAYEFQVPTPWHNSMIKVAGDNTLYLGRAEMVHAAIRRGDFDGGWVEDAAEGGHFALRAVSKIVVETGVVTDCSSMSSDVYSSKKEAVGMECEVAKMVVVKPGDECEKSCLGLGLRRKVYRILESSRRLVRRKVGQEVSKVATI